jgi:hypothetical protein
MPDRRSGKCNAHTARFPRDATGRLDLEEGTYDETESTYLSVKYEKEVRLCLGCAVTKDTDWSKKGRTAVPFDYSGKIILSILDYDKHKKTEIERVQTGLKDGGAWVVNTLVPGSFTLLIQSKNSLTLAASRLQNWRKASISKQLAI